MKNSYFTINAKRACKHAFQTKNMTFPRGERNQLNPFLCKRFTWSLCKVLVEDYNMENVVAANIYFKFRDSGIWNGVYICIVNVNLYYAHRLNN